VTLSAIGTFDNFNRFALRGVAAARTESLYDTLFVTSMMSLVATILW
jgi:microcin C transport system substrate-binding protein